MLTPNNRITQARRAWRDERLAELAKHKRALAAKVHEFDLIISYITDQHVCRMPPSSSDVTECLVCLELANLRQNKAKERQ